MESALGDHVGGAPALVEERHLADRDAGAERSPGAGRDPGPASGSRTLTSPDSTKKIASAWSPSRNTTSPAVDLDDLRPRPRPARSSSPVSPPSSSWIAEVLGQRLGRRSRTAARMRSSHHSSAPSASGNECAAMSSSTPTGASATTSTQPTSSSAARRLDSIEIAAPSRLPMRLQSSTTASTPAMSSTTLRNSRSVEPKKRSPCSSNTATESACSREQLVVLGGAHAVRAGLAAVVAAPHHGADLGLEAQRMEVEVGGHALAHLDAAGAVAPRVERRREHADAELARAAPRPRRRRRRSSPGARRCRPTRPRSRTSRTCSSR